MYGDEEILRIFQLYIIIFFRLPLSHDSYVEPPEMMESLPALELVQPLVVANPSLFGPPPLTYFYDYYSLFPIRHPCCCTICSPCFYQLSSPSFSYENVSYLTTPEARYHSCMSGLCHLTSCGSLGHLARSYYNASTLQHF